MKTSLAIVVLLLSPAFAQEYPTAYTQVYVRLLTVNGAKTILPLSVPAGYSTTGVINYTLLCRDFVHSQTSTAVATYSIVKDVNGNTFAKVITTALNNTPTTGAISGQILLAKNTAGGYNLKAQVLTTGLSSPVCTIHFAIAALTD